MPVKSKFAKKKEEKKEEEAKWLCTFNDLMTLLLTFFVLLFTMGSIDLKDMKTMQGSLQSALGILEAGDMTSIAVVAPVVNNVNFGVGMVDYTKGEYKLAKALEELDVEAGVSVEQTETGALIRRFRWKPEPPIFGSFPPKLRAHGNGKRIPVLRNSPSLKPIRT